MSEIETKLYKAPVEIIRSISKMLGMEWPQSVPEMARILEEGRPLLVRFVFVFTKDGDRIHVDYGSLVAGLDEVLREVDAETRKKLLNEFLVG